MRWPTAPARMGKSDGPSSVRRLSKLCNAAGRRFPRIGSCCRVRSGSQFPQDRLFNRPMTDIASTPGVLDDVVSAFQIEGLPVRGRVVRLGQAVDEVLTRHAYPEPVANLLGEACALAALVGSSLKFEGRLIIQAQGDGPVRYVVVDYDTSGGLRGYCRFDPDEGAAVSEGFARPGAKTLL